MASRTIAGVRVSDPAMLELLEQAQEQGFRIEEASNGHGLGKKQAGFVVYPPDSTLPPIRFGVSEANKGHVANIRGDLRRAGFVDKPVSQADALEALLEDFRGRTEGNQQRTVELVVAAYLRAGTGKNEDVVERASYVMAGVAQETGLNEAERELLRGVTLGFFAATTSHTYADAVALGAHAEIHAREDVQQAMALAEEAERERDAARKAAESADEKATAARKDCGEALARAKAAEAERDELKRVIEPLKAFLGSKA